MARARSMARERYRAPVNHLKKNNIVNKNKRAPVNHLKKETKSKKLKRNIGE